MRILVTVLFVGLSAFLLGALLDKAGRPPTEIQECKTIENLVAGDDDKPFWTNTAYASVTLVKAACYCGGTCTTPATIDLEVDDGSVASVTGTVNCAAASTLGATALSGGETTVTQFETVRFDVTNTTDPTTDDYTLCLTYKLD